MIRDKTISYENILANGYPVRVSTAGRTTQKGGGDDSNALAACLAASDPCGAAANDPCASATPAEAAAAAAVVSDPDRADLTWLLHRAAQHMRVGLDEAAREHGLSGARDWIVLSAIAAGPRQTQLALAQSLGLDKTTLTSLLDRLEAAGLVTRDQDSRDRRARIPGLTEAGGRVQQELIAARDRAEEAVLGRLSADEQRVLRALLNRLAEGPADDARAAGSCM